MTAINELKRFCEDCAKTNGSWAEEWINHSFRRRENAKKNEEILGDWLQAHRALPWYLRWWQRLIFPVARLEKFYEAQQILAINETQPLKDFLAALKQIHARLIWFSPLRSEIRKAEHLIQQEIKLGRQGHPEKGKEKTDHTKSTSKTIPQEERAVPALSPELPLRLTKEGLQACEELGIDTSKSITQSDIKRAYRAMAMRYHPDKNLGREKEASEEFQDMRKAYEFLEGFFDKTIDTSDSEEVDWNNIAMQIANLKEFIKKSEEGRKEEFRQHRLYCRERLEESAEQLRQEDNNFEQQLQAQQQHHDAQMQEQAKQFEQKIQVQSEEIKILKQEMQAQQQHHDSEMQQQREEIRKAIKQEFHQELQAQQQQLQDIMAKLEKGQQQKEIKKPLTENDSSDDEKQFNGHCSPGFF